MPADSVLFCLHLLDLLACNANSLPQSSVFAEMGAVDQDRADVPYVPADKVMPTECPQCSLPNGAESFKTPETLVVKDETPSLSNYMGWQRSLYTGCFGPAGHCWTRQVQVGAETWYQYGVGAEVPDPKQETPRPDITFTCKRHLQNIYRNKDLEKLDRCCRNTAICLSAHRYRTSSECDCDFDNFGDEEPCSATDVEKKGWLWGSKLYGMRSAAREHDVFCSCGCFEVD